MNEQLQSKLVEILTSIQSAVKQGGDFAMEQLPDIALQYVAYGRATYTLRVLIGLLGIAFLVSITKAARKALNNEDPWPLLVYLFGSLGIALTLVYNTGPALMVWFAPKIWLIKEFAELLK